MNYRERAREALEKINSLHKDDKYESCESHGQLFFEFQAPGEALRISSEIMSNIYEFMPSEDIEDLIFTLYMNKLRFSITGF